MAVSVKMGVDIGGFVGGIKEGQQILKGLNAELKASEAEFKATGDAEKKLEDQTKTLNSQIAVQKGIADQAKQALEKMVASGVDPADAAYQKLYTQMMNAQAGANEAQAALNALGTEAKGAATEATNLTTSMNGISKKISLKQVIDGIDKITSGLEDAAKKAVKLGKAIVTEVLGAGSWADDLATTAQAYGITPEELQRMQKTAQIIDTDAETILSAKQKLAKNNEKLIDLVGFSADGMSLEDMFWKTGEAIMGMTDAVEQEEAAQKLFGKGWRDLVPVFTAGREEYEKVNESWNVVSEEQLQKLTEMDDKYQALKNDLDTLKMETLSQLAEPLTNVMNALSEILGSEEGQAVINSVMGTIKDTLNWIAENQSAVVTAIGAIAAAFAGLKVSETVLRFVELSSGLKGLFGGGSGSSAATGAAAAGGTGGGGWLSNAAKKIGTGAVSAGKWVVGSGALIPAGLTAAALLPAMIAQNQNAQVWESEYQRRMAAAELPGANADFIRRAAEALGNGNGQTNLSSATDLLMGLSAYQNQQKAELYNLLSGSATAGNSTWGLLNTLWNGGELDPGQVDELLQNVTDAFAADAEKVKVPMEPEMSGDAAAEIAAQIGTVSVPVSAVVVPDGEHANGLWHVPYDGYLARLHRGERVVPAREVGNRNYSSNLYVESMYMNNGTDAAGLAAAMAAAQRRTMAGYGS